MLEHLQSVMELFFIKCILLLCRTTIITILIIFWAAKNIHFSICLWGTGWFRMGKSQTQSKRINITCILLIPTTSDRWMKAFRKSTYPCDGPNSIDLHPSLWMSALFYFFYFKSLSSMIVAASRMPIYLQSLQQCPVQNREIKFYKGFFSKRKKYQIWVLKRKSLSGTTFSSDTLMMMLVFCFFFVRFFFSSHAKYTCIYNTY